MSFSNMLKDLRESNEYKIVFINSGAFFIAIEEDAVLLHNKLELKCNCFQKYTCKVGIPLNSLDKYLERIENLGYGYIVYWLDREKTELKVIREYEGKDNDEENANINCIECKGLKNRDDDCYSVALLNYYLNKKREKDERK